MAVIRIEGASARLVEITAPAAHLTDCLRFEHPGRKFVRAFKEGRWDGYVSFADGNRFPVGFALRVKAHLESAGYPCTIDDPSAKPLEAPEFDRDYLHGISLYDHQMEAVRAMLAHPRGFLKEPTGSGKTAMCAAAARLFWEKHGWRSLIVVPKKGLARQTRDAFARFYGGEVEVGLASEGLRLPGPIVVATAQTLIHFKDRKVTKTEGTSSRKVKVDGDEWLRELIESTNVIFFDECHRTSSESWQQLAQACPAIRRYGLSGTPLTERELADVRLEGATGPLIHESNVTKLIQRGLAARPKIVMVAAEAASEMLDFEPSKYSDAYREAITDSDAHNNAVVLAVKWLIEHKRRVLVLCRLKQHFVNLATMLVDDGIEMAALWGDTATNERVEAKEMFARQDIQCILATTIFDEGEDVRGIDAIVLAEGVTANTSALQRIGRGMRRDSEDVWVVDFVPLGSDVLIEHASKRAAIYEREGYEVRVLESWPEDQPSLPPDDLLPFETWDQNPPAS